MTTSKTNSADKMHEKFFKLALLMRRKHPCLVRRIKKASFRLIRLIRHYQREEFLMYIVDTFMRCNISIPYIIHHFAEMDEEDFVKCAISFIMGIMVDAKKAKEQKTEEQNAQEEANN